LVELNPRIGVAVVASALMLLASGLASAQPAHRVGPSYLYPTAATPGAVNTDVTQANIADTICKSGWTATIRPPVSYTNNLKRQQLADPKRKDKMPSHYEEDHFISLELGGHPRDPKNLWPEMWGTPATPLTYLNQSVTMMCCASWSVSVPAQTSLWTASSTSDPMQVSEHGEQRGRAIEEKSHHETERAQCS
jgi:hypothetical protein